MKFPEQKKDLPGAREVKNSLVIDGTFDKAFEQITQMPIETGNLDAIHAILGQLVHDAVDRAFEAAQGQTGSVQALRKAFITSLVEGSSEAGRRPAYQLTLKFENAELLGQAGDELNWMLRQDVTHVVPVAEVTREADGSPGGVLGTTVLPAALGLTAGTKLYADKRGVLQDRQLVLPKPDNYCTWDGDGQFGDWELSGKNGVPFYSATTVRHLLGLRASWEFVGDLLAPIHFLGVLDDYQKLPVPQSCKEGDAYLVLGQKHPDGLLYRNSGVAWTIVRSGKDASRGTMVNKWLIFKGVPIYRAFTKVEDLPSPELLAVGIACLVKDEASGVEDVYVVDQHWVEGGSKQVKFWSVVHEPAAPAIGGSNETIFVQEVSALPPADYCDEGQWANVGPVGDPDNKAYRVGVDLADGKKIWIEVK